MNKQQRVRPMILVALVAALPLAACGGETATVVESAHLSITATPAAKVTIDGKEHGTTPLKVEVAPGAHDIELTAEGFAPVSERVEVVKGETQAIEHFLALASVDGSGITEVAKELGIEFEPFEAPTPHRGGSDEVFTQYWPRGKVRMDALRSFRIDVGESYGDDVPLATLVFKKGKKVLHKIDEFDPATTITVADFPKEVLKQLKPGTSFSWGLEFDRRHKKFTEDVKVSVVGKSEDKKVTKAVEKIRNKKYFKRQDPVVQATLLAQTLENKRLYTEALLAYLSILEQNPGVTSPFRGVVQTLRRMKLDKSAMFDVASQFVGGKGRAKSGAIAQPGIAGYGPSPSAMTTLVGPKDTTASGGTGYQPGGAVQVDPNAKAPESDAPPADAGGNDNGAGNAGTPNNDGAQNNGAVQNNDGSVRNDGSAPNNNGDQNNPAVNNGESNEGSVPFNNGSTGGSPVQDPQSTLSSAQQRLEQLQQKVEALASSGATDAQIAAAYNEYKKAQQAVEQMTAALQGAVSGDANAEQAFQQAQQAFDAAEQSTLEKAPEDPNDLNGPATPAAPPTFEDALRQLMETGTAPGGANQLMEMVRANRQAQDALRQASANTQSAKDAYRAAEAAIRALPDDASEADKQAAEQAVQQAEQAVRDAEEAERTAEAQASQMQTRTDEAMRNNQAVVERAQAILRGEG